MFSSLNRQKPVVIAFSGGADSCYLLEKIGEQIAKNILTPHNIILAHYNHCLRGAESERDEDFSRKISQKFGLVFETQRRGEEQKNEKIPEKISDKISEEHARNLRYTFLETIRKKYDAQCVITAHHQDDQAETIFLQMIRGGGINALSGMKTFCAERKIFRPLLSIAKQQILDELHRKNIDFCEDSTNSESLFTRNFLRNEVFPLLEQKFSGFSARLAEKSKYFNTLQAEVETVAQKFIDHSTNKKDSEISFSRKSFLSLFSPVQFEIIKVCIAPKYCHEKFFHQVQDFIATAPSGKKFETKIRVFRVFGDQVFIEGDFPSSS